MTTYYSQTTKGFYHTELHGTNMPSDAVEVSEQEYHDLLNGHSNNKEIAPDEFGAPTLVEQTVRELTYAEKRQREYPPVTDYIDGVVKGDQTQIQAYIDACLAVKSKYPKE